MKHLTEFYKFMRHYFLSFLVAGIVCNVSIGAETRYSSNRYEPVAIDSRIKTFIYSENEIYNLKFRIGYNSIIEFSKDEAIETISLGDPYPWKITPLDRRLFMKPVEPGVKTNMTVITNKRVYLFEIESDISANRDSIDVVHVARFFYPSIADRIENPQALPSNNRLADIRTEKRTNDSIDNINMLYSFAGKSNASTPIEIFDDGKQTYLRFKKGVNYDAIAVSSVKGKKKTKLKLKKTGDFIVLDTVFAILLIEYNNAKTEVYNDLLEL